MGISWNTGSHNPDTGEDFPGRDPISFEGLHGLRLTRRGRGVLTFLALIIFLALMALAGGIEQ